MNDAPEKKTRAKKAKVEVKVEEAPKVEAPKVETVEVKVVEAPKAAPKAEAVASRREKRLEAEQAAGRKALAKRPQ